jgi:hypothetical protein
MPILVSTENPWLPAKGGKKQRMEENGTIFSIPSMVLIGNRLGIPKPFPIKGG